jgi:hypothetical protein
LLLTSASWAQVSGSSALMNGVDRDGRADANLD